MGKIKKIISILLAILITANLFFFASGKLETQMFWLNLGIIALISYFFFNDKNFLKKKK